MRTLKTKEVAVPLKEKKRTGRPKGSKNRQTLFIVESEEIEKVFPVIKPTNIEKENISEKLLTVAKKNINGHAFQGGVKNSFYIQTTGGHNVGTTIKENRKGRISKEEIREAFLPFSEIPNRNQLVRIINGIKFINDSFSVNLNSAWFSLEKNEGPIVWIMGGLDIRNNNYQLIFELVKKKVKTIIFLGNQSFKTDQIFGKVIPFIFHTENMKDAVEVAYHCADRGDTVLLSPACSSLDMFENFEDRGSQFEKYTLALE